MPFLLLLVLALACVVQTWPEPPQGWSVVDAVSASWTAIAGMVLLAGVIGQATRRALEQKPERREAILRWYHSLRGYHLLGLIGVYTATLCLLGWGWSVQRICTVGEAMLPGAELLLLAPFVAGLIFSWACFYDAERASHETLVPLFSRPFWGRWTYVRFHARQNFALVAAPLMLVVLGMGLQRQFPDLRYQEWFAGASLAMLIVVFACLPWILRLALGLQPLPSGRLRDRLEATARRLNFRCSDILLWNTHDGVANAMVVGMLRRPRYVVLSDRLISGLSEDEIEAVFGHEVGHVKHHHMVYYLSFLLISVGVLGMVGQLVANAAAGYFPDWNPRLHEEYAILPFFPLLLLYIFLVFGFLSRRCERQADIFGCRAVSCAEPACPGHTAEVRLQPKGLGLCPTGIRTFIGALEKVATLNGISRSKPGWLRSWQHSTIARRVEFLQHMLGDPSLEPRFQRRVWHVKCALLLGLVALLAILMWATEV